MNDNLLREFIEDEYDSDVRDTLLSVIQESKSRPALMKRDFAFNRFNVILDFEFQRVIIEDDLMMEEPSECELGMEAFVQMLNNGKVN